MNKTEVEVLILIDFVFDSVDPLICGPSIEFVGIIAWSINQVSISLVFSYETQPTGKNELREKKMRDRNKNKTRKCQNFCIIQKL